MKNLDISKVSIWHKGKKQDFRTSAFSKGVVAMLKAAMKLETVNG
jgi:hypothetical protein